MKNRSTFLKRLSIVTWIGEGNYGTSLQSFALHEYLKRQGYDVSILAYMPTTEGIRSFLLSIAKALGLLYLKEKWELRAASLKRKKFSKFNHDNYIIPNIYTPNQRNLYIKNTDVFIAGSDQIWNTYYKFSPTMFLSFVSDKRKIAYASSIGANSIKEEYQDKVKSLLLDFYRIGVRETTAVEVLSNLTLRNDIVQVMDPTFLLNKHEWSEIAKEAHFEFFLPKKYIFCYFIGNNKIYYSQLLDVIKKLDILDVCIIPSEENPDFKIDGSLVLNDVGPLEFLYLLNNSSFVCTDSFHATALSINMNKNFIEFKRFPDTQLSSQNSRIYDLLASFSLMDRLYSVDSESWKSDINYQTVGKILEEERARSKSFLLSAINN